MTSPHLGHLFRGPRSHLSWGQGFSPQVWGDTVQPCHLGGWLLGGCGLRARRRGPCSHSLCCTPVLRGGQDGAFLQHPHCRPGPRLPPRLCGVLLPPPTRPPPGRPHAGRAFGRRRGLHPQPTPSVLWSSLRVQTWERNAGLENIPSPRAPRASPPGDSPGSFTGAGGDRRPLVSPSW